MLTSPTQLLGVWRLSRTIVDMCAAQSGTVHGQLVLRTEDPHIVWQECGELDWNNHRVAVSRGYRLRQSTEGWHVDFADGRPFHPWLPGEWVHHPCHADTYRGLITISSQDEWHTQWEISGPHKSLHISTDLSRQA